MTRKHRKTWYAIAAFYALSIVVCAIAGDEIAAAFLGWQAADVLATDDDGEE